MVCPFRSLPCFSDRGTAAPVRARRGVRRRGPLVAKFLSAVPGTPAASLPFSFTYDGKPFAETLAGWQTHYTERELDALRQEAVVTYTDPARPASNSAASPSAIAIFPRSSGRFISKTRGTSDKQLIEVIQAIDAHWEREGPGAFLLHHEFGTFYPNSPADFMPQESANARPREPDQALHPEQGPGVCRRDAVFQSRAQRARGRDRRRPLARAAWAAEFARDDKTGIRVTARRTPRTCGCAGRGDPHAADGAAILARRLDPGAEHLAPLDDRAQPAEARRTSARADLCRVGGRPVRQHGQGHRGQPDPVHRPLPRGAAAHRLLVDGRRLV